MSSLLKNLLLVLGLVMLLGLGYVLFFRGDGVVLESENARITSEAARDADEYLHRLQQLRQIEIEEALFRDERFESLVDHRQAITPEPVGREDPFAPIR